MSEKLRYMSALAEVEEESQKAEYMNALAETKISNYK